MNRLARILAFALLALAIAIPGVATATESDNPLADLPPEYEPALDAAAEEFGVDADALKTASRAELEDLLCEKLAELTPDEIAAKAEAAVESLPEEDLAELTPERRAELKAQLPDLILAVQTQVCTDSGDDGATGADDADDDAEDDADAGADGTGDIPTPTRIDTGAGGTATPTAVLAVALAGVLALLGGVTVAGRRRG